MPYVHVHALAKIKMVVGFRKPFVICDSKPKNDFSVLPITFSTFSTAKALVPGHQISRASV